MSEAFSAVLARSRQAAPVQRGSLWFCSETSVLHAPQKLEPDSPMLSMQESLAYVIQETVKLSTI